MIWAYKLRGCVDCKRKPVEAGGELAMADLECHHRDPATKNSNGGGQYYYRGIDASSFACPEDLLAELALCDVLCAECHNKRHRDGGRHEQTVLFRGTGHAWEPG